MNDSISKTESYSEVTQNEISNEESSTTEIDYDVLKMKYDDNNIENDNFSKVHFPFQITNKERKNEIKPKIENKIKTPLKLKLNVNLNVKPKVINELKCSDSNSDKSSSKSNYNQENYNNYNQVNLKLLELPSIKNSINVLKGILNRLTSLSLLNLNLNKLMDLMPFPIFICGHSLNTLINQNLNDITLNNPKFYLNVIGEKEMLIFYKFNEQYNIVYHQKYNIILNKTYSSFNIQIFTFKNSNLSYESLYNLNSITYKSNGIIINKKPFINKLILPSTVIVKNEKYKLDCLIIWKLN